MLRLGWARPSACTAWATAAVEWHAWPAHLAPHPLVGVGVVQVCISRLKQVREIPPHEARQSTSPITMHRRHTAAWWHFHHIMRMASHAPQPQQKATC